MTYDQSDSDQEDPQILYNDARQESAYEGASRVSRGFAMSGEVEAPKELESRHQAPTFGVL
jgi:hypothetical protein